MTILEPLCASLQNTSVISLQLSHGALKIYVSGTCIFSPKLLRISPNMSPKLIFRCRSMNSKAIENPYPRIFFNMIKTVLDNESMIIKNSQQRIKARKANELSASTAADSKQTGRCVL